MRKKGTEFALKTAERIESHVFCKKRPFDSPVYPVLLELV
jgi:hypothetical protein